VTLIPLTWNVNAKLPSYASTKKNIKKELDSEYKTDTIIFSFFVITRHFSLQYTKDKWVTCDDKAHRQ